MAYFTGGNFVSLLAFLVWIPVALWGMRRWPPAKATAYLFFGGLLLLPEVVWFKPAGLPRFAKLEIILFWLFVGALLFHRQRLRSVPKNTTFCLLASLLYGGAIVTVFLNSDPLTIGFRFVPGQVPYDAVHAIIGASLRVILPFYLGLAMFRSSQDLRVLFKTIAGAALLYTLLMLVEFVLSPQLHNWVYGFAQHGFDQTIRADGGYRPMVFMAHGLAVALFTSSAIVAAVTLHKAKVRIFRFPASWTAGYLWLTLAWTKSAASILYASIATPLILFAKPRVQVLTGTALVFLLLAYPVARHNDWIPVDELKEWAEDRYGEDRMKSMMFRFENEEKLLERAMERRWFGWGGYCRACLFAPWSASLLSIRDGEWIIQFGDQGIVGFVAKFSLLLFPLILLLRELKFIPREPDRRLLGGLALMVGFTSFDLIPNGDFSRLQLLLSGVLLGCLSGIRQQTAGMARRKRAKRTARAKAESRSASPVAGTAAVMALFIASAVSAAPPDAIGGGFMNAGVRGEYYANPELEGAPSFTRRDPRIDFEWKGPRPVGGSTAEPYRSFPTDGFSVRWTGEIIARFEEDYTFHGRADDGLRLSIRAPGDSEWTTLVDQWADPGTFESRAFRMRAGEAYGIRVEYREERGDAECVVRWRSRSTPSEVIDPVRQQGINLTQHVWARFLWADAMKGSRYGHGSDDIDGDGWPIKSGVEVVMSEQLFPSASEMAGTYLLRFGGRAEVAQECCNNPVFSAEGRTYQLKLPAGRGYDRASNTTALMTLDGSRTMLTFNDARRRPGSRDDGVARVQLMRPVAQGASEHHAPDEIVYRPFKRIVEGHYTVIRYVMSDREVGGEWSDRARPDYAFFIRSSGHPNWEYLVMLANETGSDLYITTPIGATDEYLEKLALLLRYGSDGDEPYRGATVAPVYPPLNANLRLYFEIDNEIWNWAFESTHVAARLTKAEHDARSNVWKAIDFDGRAGNPGWATAMRRWHATRTVQASNTFRRIWGDDAMGARIRPLIEYQYDNYQETALSSLDFIDAYYNNRAGDHVSDPHPVSYFVWGGGGAAYYGLANSDGEQSHTKLEDPSFEARPITPGTTVYRPEGTAWSFRGKAGLIHPQEGRTIEGFESLGVPKSGKQAAFLIGRGAVSQRVRFAKAGHYAIAFAGAGITEGWPPYQPFDVLIDDRKVSPRDQSDLRVSPETAVIGGWNRNLNTLEGEWGSAVFEIDEPGLHTITFVGRDDAPNYLVLDAVRVASADVVMMSGFDKGEALGQEGDPDFAYQLRTQARYARSFGLQVVAYESGWSLGGDFHQTPLQNWCKLEDPRAKKINDEALRLWDRSGSFLPIWGVYKYWPTYDFAGAATYPIMQSFRGATQRLRAESTYGRAIPTTLRVDDVDWSHASEATGWRKYVPWINRPSDRWLSWMLLAPRTHTYSIKLFGNGTGKVVIEVDGQPLAELDSLGTHDPGPIRVKLTKGAHAIRAVVVGDIDLDKIEVSDPQP